MDETGIAPIRCDRYESGCSHITPATEPEVVRIDANTIGYREPGCPINGDVCGWYPVWTREAWARSQWRDQPFPGDEPIDSPEA